MKQKMSVRDQWTDGNEKYVEIRIGKYEACCVKIADGLTYVLQCDNGYEVYSDIGGADFPLRKLGEEEYEQVIRFAKGGTKGMRTPNEIEAEIKVLQESQDGSFAKEHPAYFVGGRYHGVYMTHKELMRKGNGQFTIRWSALTERNPLTENLDLEDQPLIDGYLSPMWDGGYLRYETQEVYDRLSD